MISIKLVFFIACLSPSIHSEISIDDRLSEIFGKTKNEPIDRLDLMLIKRVATSSRYNFLVTPMGLKLALCSLAEAAADDTRSELLSVVGLDLNGTTDNNKYTTISSSLKKKSPLFIRNLGNWIFISDDLVPRQKVVVTAQDTYSTEVKTVNKHDPFEAAKQINSWVSNDTQGKITDTFNEYDVSKMAILVLNTFYFKSSWRYYIATDATKVDQFYVSPTTLKNVPFMHVFDYFGYVESSKLDVKILRMPYEVHFSVYFIVPNSLMGLSHVLDNLSILSTEIESASGRDVDVTLPKFNIDYTSELSGILKELGVNAAFQDTASFPGIGRNTLPHERIKISKLMQRFEFGINEHGSDIYSTKGSHIKRNSKNATLEVVANRPFLFLLHDESTREFLLIGRISDPTVAQGYFEVVFEA